MTKGDKVITAILILWFLFDIAKYIEQTVSNLEECPVRVYEQIETKNP